MAQLTAELNEELAKAGAADFVEVVVQLRRGRIAEASQGASRSEKVAALKESFDHEVEPVEKVIRQIGGQVTDRAWINQSLRARVPAQKVEELASHEGVQRVDVPRPVTRELA